MRASSDAATEDCVGGTSFFDSGGGACCAEAAAEQKIAADSTAILFMALLLREAPSSLQTPSIVTRQSRTTTGRGARAERWLAALPQNLRRPGEQLRADS